MDVGAKTICNLFIGKDWSRIAIFSEGNLILSREIKSGIQSMVDAIRADIDTEPGLETNRPDDLAVIESMSEKRPAYDGEAAQDLLNRFIQERLSGDATVAPSVKDDVYAMIVPAMERIVRQVERTVEHYALNFKKRFGQQGRCFRRNQRQSADSQLYRQSVGISGRGARSVCRGYFVSRYASNPRNRKRKGRFYSGHRQSLFPTMC